MDFKNYKNKSSEELVEFLTYHMEHFLNEKAKEKPNEEEQKEI